MLCILIATVFCINLAGFEFGVVVSGSMRPVLNKNDLVLINPREKFTVGKVLAFEVNGIGLVVHRILRVMDVQGQTYYLCAGDNNPFEVEIDGTSMNLTQVQDRINYLNALPINEAMSSAENLVKQQDAIGVVTIKFAGIGGWAKIIFNHRILMLVLILLLLACAGKPKAHPVKKYIKRH